MIPVAPPPHLLVNVDEITAMGREHPGVGDVLDALGRLAAAMPPPRRAAPAASLPVRACHTHPARRNRKGH